MNVIHVTHNLRYTWYILRIIKIILNSIYNKIKTRHKVIAIEPNKAFFHYLIIISSNNSEYLAIAVNGNILQVEVNQRKIISFWLLGIFRFNLAPLFRINIIRLHFANSNFDYHYSYRMYESQDQIKSDAIRVEEFQNMFRNTH